MTDFDPAAIMAEHTGTHWCAVAYVGADCLPYQLAEMVERAWEELRQGWPKMARDANRSAIEQWNRADALAAENAALREQVIGLQKRLRQAQIDYRAGMAWIPALDGDQPKPGEPK